jgi:ubiquinol-cytochrome c reductase subunit 7
MEALRRLPEDVLQGRMRRMKIASQCYLTHTEVQPHITEEQDVAYLTPYLKEVEREDHDRIAYWQ